MNYLITLLGIALLGYLAYMGKDVSGAVATIVTVFITTKGANDAHERYVNSKTDGEVK